MRGGTRARRGSRSRPGCRSCPRRSPGTDRIARLAPLRVVYGTPIALDDLRDRAAKDAAAEATDRLRAEIERLEATL